MAHENSAVVEYSGFTVTVRASTPTPPEDRHGDHATYLIELTPDAAVLAEEGMAWQFSGEIERRLASMSLRKLADLLDAL